MEKRETKNYYYFFPDFTTSQTSQNKKTKIRISNEQITLHLTENHMDF